MSVYAYVDREKFDTQWNIVQPYKWNAILPFSETWMNLEAIIPRKI